MPVPEASMYKNHGVHSREDDVWLTGQIATMKAKPESLAMQQAANQNLGFGITATYPCHHAAAGRAIDNIYHLSKSILSRILRSVASASVNAQTNS